MDCSVCPKRLECLSLQIDPRLCSAVVQAMFDIIQEATRRGIITENIEVVLSAESIIRDNYEEVQEVGTWLEQNPTGDWIVRNRAYRFTTEDPEVDQKSKWEDW